MQAICEILPSALPSLVLCLQTIINYDKNEEIIMLKTKELTKCDYKNSEAGFILDTSVIKNITLNQYDCGFPGSNIYKCAFTAFVTQSLKCHSKHFCLVFFFYVQPSDF